MIVALRTFFIVVFVTMVAITSWAGAHVALWAIPASVGGHPWFIATLFDTYWAFFTFYVWLFYKEPSWAARLLWFLAIMLMGNMAMAAYALAVLFRVRADAEPAEVLLRGRPVSPWVPAGLIAAFGLVAAGAAVF